MVNLVLLLKYVNEYLLRNRQAVMNIILTKSRAMIFFTGLAVSVTKISSKVFIPTVIMLAMITSI